MTELDFANQQALFEEARLDVREAEIEVEKARQALRARLGLWGDTERKAPSRLAAPPERELERARAREHGDQAEPRSFDR